MASDNIVTTNVDLGNVILEGGEFIDETLTFAGGTYPRTMLEGSILARDSASGKMIPFVIGGVTNNDGVPKTVLTYDVTIAAAGDAPIRNLVSGKVRAPRLIVDADGDNSNITPGILDQLRDYSIVALEVNELSQLDNQ